MPRVQRKNGKRRVISAWFVSMAVLFLSLRLGNSSRTISIVCSLFRGQGQISSPMSGAQAFLPSRTGTRGNRLCMCRIQCTRPSRQQRSFRECPASAEAPQVPRLGDRYARLQLVVCFENQGQWAKTFHHPLIRETGNIRVSTLGEVFCHGFYHGA
jgi:hypothetical protein